MEKNYEFTLAKASANLKMILEHKYHVFIMCNKAGIPFRGLLHDISKLNPIEFYEYTKYTANNRSPVDNCKDAKGYCESWQHHKGHNPHHAEYWIDNVMVPGQEPVALIMPFEYATEMICDFIGAGKVYEKGNWDFSSPIKWWRAVGSQRRIHPVIKKYVETIFLFMEKDKDYSIINYGWLNIIYKTMYYEYEFWGEEEFMKKNYLEIIPRF